jgi:hypothetical protein
MKYKFLIIYIQLISGLFYAQDSTISQAYKSSRADNIYPLIKAKAPSYPLMTAYLLQKYASQGDPFAQHEIGLRHLLGKGFPKDTLKAVEFIKKAAEKNLTAAIYNYSIMLENGIGTEWNPFSAFKQVKVAAENGMPEAQFFYGIFFTDNLVVNRNYPEAYKWFSKAAGQNLEPAVEAKKKMEESGLIILTENESVNGEEQARIDSSVAGSSTIFDPKFELDFFNFDAEDVSSKENLSKIYEKNFSEIKSSLGISEITDSTLLPDTSGRALVEYAAERGSPEGLLILAKDYELGISKNKNLTKAVQSYIKAYRLGSMKAVEHILKNIREENFFGELKKETEAHNPDAMYVWAGLIAMGFDYQLTNEQALDLLENAVKLNHIYSLIEKGLCYYTGTLVEKDKNKAYEYWQRASKLGSSEAAIRLAFSSLVDDKTVNTGMNIELLESAANEGSVLAQSALGFCYENAIGLKVDKAEATRYYRSAANRGSEVAYNSLKRMYDEIRPVDKEFVIYEEN